MYSIATQEDLQKYRNRLDSFLSEAVGTVLHDSQKFFPHLAVINQEGEFGFKNLTPIGNDVEEMVNFSTNFASYVGAVSAVLFFTTWFPKFDEDDPNLEALKSGVLDMHSIPNNKKQLRIMIYGETLGPYRKLLAIPVNDEREISGDVEEINCKMFDYDFLIKQNESVN